MPTSYGALCTDFYINHKLGLKLEMTEDRETILGFFERIRRSYPRMTRLRRFDEEITLEAPELDAAYQWISVQNESMRAGVVNPDEISDAHEVHLTALETAPYYLSLTALDVDYLEVTFGFDLEARTNRDAAVFNALYADAPLRDVVEGEAMLAAQPVIGFALDDSCDTQAYVEIKTRMRAAEVAAGVYDDEPISIFTTVRRYGAVSDVRDLTRRYEELARQAQELVDGRVAPRILQPIREALLSPPR